MTGKKQTAKDVETYLSGVPAEMAAPLRALRKAIRAAAPEAEETMRMGAVTYLYRGNLFSFAAASRHYSFYVMSPGPIVGHRARLKGFDTAPTAIRLKPHERLPDDLVAEIVVDRMRENETRR